MAGLVYVAGEEPGMRRIRRGKGFSYLDHEEQPLTDAEVKARIIQLAIPPAWTKVWICPNADGHILATGQDDKGRKQYIYHPRWRAIRDMLNFYRLILFSAHLAEIREHTARQLRRRTFDRDRMLAAMIRIIDLTQHPDRQRGLRRGERQLRADHTHPQARPGTGRPGQLRLSRQVGQAVGRHDHRRRGGADGGASCWPSAAAGCSAWTARR